MGKNPDARHAKPTGLGLRDNDTPAGIAYNGMHSLRPAYVNNDADTRAESCRVLGRGSPYWWKTFEKSQSLFSNDGATWFRLGMSSHGGHPEPAGIRHLPPKTPPEGLHNRRFTRVIPTDDYCQWTERYGMAAETLKIFNDLG